MSQKEVTLLLGSNLGDPRNNLAIAIRRLSELIGPTLYKTEIIDTIAVEFASNNIFCNIALIIKTQLSPTKLLNLIKKIEEEMGRTEDSSVTFQFEDRVIDIDIVEYDQLVFESRRLKIPHQRHLMMREFSKKLLLDLKTLKT